MSEQILEWQNALPSFGISYLGPKDGNMNEQFTEAMIALEGKYGVYGQLLTHSGVKISVSDAKKLFGDIVVTHNMSKEDGAKEKWIDFLSQSLPVVGKVYEGSLEEAGKKIEATIEKSIQHPMVGVIWNDNTQQFNTTPDDIKKALELIQQHQQSPSSALTKLNLDQRVTKMSQLLLEKNNNILHVY